MSAVEKMHTPAPWQFEHRVTADGHNYATEVFDKDGRTIATCSWYSIKTPYGYTTNREENARVIAAAPTMLAEMKKLAQALEDTGHEPDQSFYDAIKQAEGN